MATNTGVYTGESGVVKFVGADSTVAAVASVRSFTIDQEVQAIESTVMGSGARTYEPGLTQFSGSMDVYLRDDDGGQTNFLSYMANPDGRGEVELFPSGETTGVKLNGSVIITGHSITSNFDGMVEASITFQGSGALTRTEL
jgi:predicted secreted protein